MPIIYDVPHCLKYPILQRAKVCKRLFVNKAIEIAGLKTQHEVNPQWIQGHRWPGNRSGSHWPTRSQYRKGGFRQVMHDQHLWKKLQFLKWNYLTSFIYLTYSELVYFTHTKKYIYCFWGETVIIDPHVANIVKGVYGKSCMSDIFKRISIGQPQTVKKSF